MEDWHDAPIVYISGNQVLNFTPQQEDRLRQYVLEGGLLVFNPDCANPGFKNSILKQIGAKSGLLKRLFPDYDLRMLPEDHLIFRELFKKSLWKTKINIQAVGNGTREFALVFDSIDAARFWQTNLYKGNESTFEVMANIYTYAAGIRQRVKGDTHILSPVQLAPEKSLKIARISYRGSYDPEPAGWSRLAVSMLNSKCKLSVEPIKLGRGQLTDFKIAHLTGNQKFSLDPEELRELKQFLDGGKTLIVDACGGDAEFAASAETLLAQLLGDDARQLSTPLLKTDPIFKGIEIRYRRGANPKPANVPNGADLPPQLRAVTRNAKRIVYYSAIDLSTGMVGHEVDGINGYTPECALKIMQHILLKSTE